MKPLHAYQMAKIKKWHQVLKSMWNKGNICTLLVECKMVELWKTPSDYCKLNLHYHMTQQLHSWVFTLYPKEVKMYCPHKTCTWVFIALLVKTV